MGYSSRLKWCNLVQGHQAFLIRIFQSSAFLSEACLAHRLMKHTLLTSTSLAPGSIWDWLFRDSLDQQSDISLFEKGDECCLTLYKGKQAVLKDKPRYSLCLKRQSNIKTISESNTVNKWEIQQIKCSRATLMWEIRPLWYSQTNKP